MLTAIACSTIAVSSASFAKHEQVTDPIPTAEAPNTDPKKAKDPAEAEPKCFSFQW